jgi:hypothetical protein
MMYFVCKNINGYISILDKYPSEEMALKRLKYHVKKEKCTLEVVPIPELQVGCRLYRKDGSYYGAIAYETNALWGVSRAAAQSGMPDDPYSKQNIDNWILNQGLIVVNDNHGIDMPAMMEAMESLNKRVYKVLEGLEYLYAEQVTIFNW